MKKEPTEPEILRAVLAERGKSFVWTYGFSAALQIEIDDDHFFVRLEPGCAAEVAGGVAGAPVAWLTTTSSSVRTALAGGGEMAVDVCGDVDLAARILSSLRAAAPISPLASRLFLHTGSPR